MDFGNFWLKIGFSSLVILLISRKIVAKLTNSKGILLGLISGIILGAIFVNLYDTFGDMFPLLKEHVSRVEALRMGIPAYTYYPITILAGVAEESFWRGYVQTQLSERFGSVRGYLLSLIVYTLAHIPTFNLALVSSALVCGTIWGYLMLRYRNVLACYVSHLSWSSILIVSL